MYALENDFDYLLHLETDIFPPTDVIERLLDAKQKVVGAMYHIELGERSTLMIQQIEDFGNDLITNIFPALFGNDPDDIIGRGSETTLTGELTPGFAYLKDYVEGVGV